MRKTYLVEQKLGGEWEPQVIFSTTPKLIEEIVEGVIVKEDVSKHNIRYRVIGEKEIAALTAEDCFTVLVVEADGS